MKHIKKLALALALSTSACTMQAAPQQEPNKVVTIAKSCLKISAAAALAYLAAKQVTYENFITIGKKITVAGLSDAARRRWHLEAFSQERKKNYDQEQNVIKGVKVSTAFFVFRICHGMLDHAIG